MNANEPARCGCPGPYNTVSSTGVCDRCGVAGPRRAEAVRDALASGLTGLRTAMELGRQEGRKAGFSAGIQEGRRQAVEALLNPDHGIQAGKEPGQ